MHHMKTPPPQETLFPETKTIRVTVPVTPEVLEAFKALAAVSGVSVGKCMGEWLGDTVDGVEAMRDMMAKARSSPKLAAQQLTAYALGLSDLTTSLLEDVKRLSKTPRKAVEGSSGRSPAAGPSTALKRSHVPPSPPPGNTGGKVPKTGKKNTKGL
jgi:hypothetical protein